MSWINLRLGADGYLGAFGRRLGVAMVVLSLWAGPGAPHAAAGDDSDADSDSPPSCGGLEATIVGTGRPDVIYGTPGADVIVGGNGRDVIFGLGGDDTICGGNADDWIDGGDGGDTLLGENGRDLLRGGHGDDLASGGNGDDLLVGGFGFDELQGGRGRDECADGEVLGGCEVVPANQVPVADAGAALNATVGVPIALDGSESHDPDGDPITFGWSLVEAPAGSIAALADPAAPQPGVTPDLAGDYRFELVVSDGMTTSAAASVLMTAFAGGAPPNARAGRDLEALIASPIGLDGSGSFDPDGEALTFSWSFDSVPAGSALVDDDLADRGTATPGFTPDVGGDYVVRLTAGDAGLSDDDTVIVTAVDPNVAPHAVAGPDLAFPTGQPVLLDGVGSFDPDGGPEPLLFDWSLVSRPSASALVDADLVDPSSATMSFTPDVEGAYVFRLEVRDGQRIQFLGDEDSDADADSDSDEDSDAPPPPPPVEYLDDAENIVVYVDDVAPTLAFLQPLDGDTLDEDQPDFTITYGDDLSGVDLASFQLEVNGVDVTAEAVVTTLFAFYTPSAPLPDGPASATARIADRAGNLTETTIDFTVETIVFRAIADCSPTAGVVPLSVRFRTRGEFSGGSIVRYRWDFQGDGVFDTSDPVARDYTRTFTTAGTRNAVLQVTNNFGETATDICTIVVSGAPPTAVANAFPSNGPAPLDVALTCMGSDSDGSIVLYEWDFEGDGLFDFSSPTSGSTSHIYPDEGEFDALCRVTDNDGLSGSALVINTVIRPGPPGSPSVEATASPTSGNAPLAVSLGGSATDDGTIVLWEWDFDGDGVFDFSSPTSPATSHTYTGGGIFAAALRVTDDAGLTATDNIQITVDITANLTIPDDTFDPSAGETATVTTTISGGVPVRVFLKDGEGGVVRTLAEEFRAAGSYADVWDGTDDGGLPLPSAPYFAVLEYDLGSEVLRVDKTDTTGGTRYNPPRTRIPPVFRPLENDLLEIDFTIPSSRGASEVQAFFGLFFVDTRFVTLLDREPFGVGTHRIFWDGTGPSGSIAVPPPGDAFLFGIFGFTLPDNAIVIQSAPVLSNVAVTPNFFDPSTPDFLTPDSPTAEVSFALDKTADVELSVTNLSTGVVIRRIIDLNVVSGSGNTISWDGLADSGEFADRGDYRLTLQAFDSAGGASIQRFALVRVFH